MKLRRGFIAVVVLAMLWLAVGGAGAQEEPADGGGEAEARDEYDEATLRVADEVDDDREPGDYPPADYEA